MEIYFIYKLSGNLAGNTFIYQYFKKSSFSQVTGGYLQVNRFYKETFFRNNVVIYFATTRKGNMIDTY